MQRKKERNISGDDSSSDGLEGISCTHRKSLFFGVRALETLSVHWKSAYCALETGSSQK